MLLRNSSAALCAAALQGAQQQLLSAIAMMQSID